MKVDYSTPIFVTPSETDSNLHLSCFKQDKLRTANVMVVGCGALGNEVLKNLALFGVGHLVIVDFDTVEPSNLTRSILFNQTDAQLGRLKVVVAAERLREINPKIQVLPLAGDITHDVGLGLLRQMNVVVSCVDNRWARYCLNRLCMRANVTWVDGGIDGLEGTARVFIPGKNCYACNLGPEALKDLSYRLSCASAIKRNEQAGHVPTTPIVASIIGAVEAQEAIKLLYPNELSNGQLSSLCGKMFYYEGQHLTSRIVDFIGYDEDCPVHEQWAPIKQSELTTSLRVDEVLELLSKLLGEQEVTIHLRDHAFVDYLVTREENERKFIVMKPDHAIGTFVENDPTLSCLPFNALFQHEIKQIDSSFPYKELTLSKIGIPAWDVLHISTRQEDHYVELADEHHYSETLFKRKGL